MRSALRSPRVRRIIGAYTVNRVGTWIGLVALMVTVYDHTQSALAVAGLLLAGQALPAFVVPALVARVETSRRRGELSRLYAFEAVVTGGLVVLVHDFSLAPVLVLVALDGLASLAASALLRAELARTARAELPVDEPSTRAHERPEARVAPPKNDAESAGDRAERAANAALNVAFSATFVSGPVLAGVLVAGAGASVALLIDVGSFLVCAAMLTALHPHVDEAGGASVAARLRAAWRYITGTPALRSLLLVEMIALIFFETAAPIEVTYAKSTLHAGDRGFGLLLTVWGAGTVVGSLVFARSLKRRLGYLISAGTLLVGAGYIGFSIAPSLLLACVAALAGGLGNGIELPSLFSLVQQLTPSRLHGRVMGAVESIGAFCPVIGLPLGGALVVATDPRTAFLIVGIGTAISALALFRVVRTRAQPSAYPEPQDPAAPTAAQDATSSPELSAG